jgi:hypothetical protein
MKDSILIYDIPRNLNKIEVKVWRDLQKINAKMVHHSTWKSDDLKSLIEIATFIKKSGGSASILEEKLIF